LEEKLSRKKPIVVAIIVIIAIAGVGGYFVLKGGEEGTPALAEFEVSNLTFYPSEVEAGESVTISATVKNVGGLEGTYTVELKIDGETQETKEVTLGGGESQTVSFMVTKDNLGTYAIEIDGIKRNITFLGPPVIIVSHTVYPGLNVWGEKYSDFGNIYGEVQNNIDMNIRDIAIKATYYDNRGYIVDKESCYVDIPLLVPGQKSPFWLFGTNEEKAVEYELEIVSFHETILEPYREFEIISHELMAYGGYDYFYNPPPYSGDIYVVRGEVVNIGTQIANNVTISATFYDATGNVIGSCGTATIRREVEGTFRELVPNMLEDFKAMGLGNEMPYPASYVLQVYELE